MEAAPAFPVFEVAGDLKLTFALHLVIDFEVGEAEGTRDGLGPGLDAADHFGIEVFHHDAFVLGVVVVLFGFERVESGEFLRREKRVLEGDAALDSGLDAGCHVGDDEAAEMLLVLERVVDSKHAAPGVAIENEVVEAKAAADFFDLFDVAGQGPERGVVRDVGVSAAQLVVVVDLNAGLRQKGLHGFEIAVGKAGTAVEEQNLDGAAADLLGPDFVFAADDRNHADAGDLDAGRVEGIAWRRWV